MMLEVRPLAISPSLDDVRGLSKITEHHHWMMLEVEEEQFTPSLDDVRGTAVRQSTIIG